MDMQSESSEPTACEPPPPGRINKAAFKLFGRRKPGSAVPAIFSVRGKGESSKAAAKAPLVRSKTHDGLAEGGQGEGGAPEEPTEAPCEAAPSPPAQLRPSISSVASVKSLSFLTLLRGGSRREGGTSRRGGLRGLLGSVRWPRRARGTEDRRDEAPPPSDVLLASRSNSVEIVKEHMTLTPRPLPRTLDTALKDSTVPSEGQGMRRSQLARPISLATSPGSPPAVPSMDLLSSVLADISSLGSFDSPAASTDITSDTKMQDFRPGSPMEQGLGQNNVALPEKSTFKAAPVPSLESHLISTAGSSSTSARAPTSTATIATTPPISTLTSTPSLSPKTSSARTPTIPFVPTSKPAPAGATPIPTPTITSTTTATPIPTITSTPKTTAVPIQTITSAPKATLVLTPSITSAAKATPISPLIPTSAPKTTQVLTTSTPPPTTNITHATAPKLAPYPVSAIPSTLGVTLTPATTFTSDSKCTTVTITTPAITSAPGPKPFPVLATTCTPVSTPTLTTFTPVSKPPTVLPSIPVLPSALEPKPYPSVITTSPPAPDLIPIPTIMSAPKVTTSTSISAGGQTPVSISDSVPASASTAPKPVSSITITSTPVFTAASTSTTPLVPDLKPVLSQTSTPKPFPAPGPTTATKPADATARVEESQSSIDAGSEDGEPSPYNLDPLGDRHSPSLPHAPLSDTGPTFRQEKKLPAVSKIPVSGSGRAGKPSRDVVPEEGQLERAIPIITPVSTPAATPSVTPAVTPSQEDEYVDFAAHWNNSSQDPNVDPTKDLEMCSKLTPPTRAPGASRTTRIPVKQTQLASSARQIATTHSQPSQAKAEVPRTKIPVSKVPVRRSSNKPPTARQSPHDPPRK